MNLMGEPYRFTFGSDSQRRVIEFRAVDMSEVRMQLRQWEADTPQPIPPTRKRRWLGRDEARLITLSQKEYGVARHPAIKKQLMAELGDEPNFADPDYKEEMKGWGMRRAFAEMRILTNLSIDSAYYAELVEVLSFSGWWRLLRSAIINVSELTDENVGSAIQGLGRIYKGKPLLDQWERYCSRNNLNESYEASDHWNNRGRDYLIQAGQMGYVREFFSKSIPEQAEEIAWIISERMIQGMNAEDAAERRKKALRKKGQKAITA